MQKYDPTIKHLKDFKFNDNLEELWILKNPTNSFIKLKIFMHNDNATDSACPQLDLAKIYSSSSNDLEDISLTSKLNNAKIVIKNESEIGIKLINSNYQIKVINENEEEIKINNLIEIYNRNIQNKIRFGIVINYTFYLIFFRRFNNINYYFTMPASSK